MLNVLVGLATVFHFYNMVSALNIAYVSEQHERMQNLRQGLFSGLMFAVGMSVLILNIFF